MAQGAPKGNKFWTLRSKHGRDRIFSTPEILWEAACEYFQWCEDNPLKEDSVEVLRINGEGDRLQHEEIAKMRAFTIQGLCLYLGCNTKYFNQFENSIKNNDSESSKDFSNIITRIRDTIYNQKFTGAAAGFLNANIISRDLGLTDKTDVTSDGKALERTVIKWGDKELEV